MRTSLISHGLCAFLSIAIGVLLCRSCHKAPAATPVRIDTVKVPVQQQAEWYTPQIAVFEGGHIPDGLVIRVDSFIQYEYLPVDTAAILRDYFARLYYVDTIRTQYGTLTLFDSLSQNRIKRRRWELDFTVPEITRTKEAPKRNQLYLGGSETYHTLTGETYTGAQAMFLQKRGWALDIEASVNNSFLWGQPPDPLVRVGYKKLISFRRH